METVKTQSLNRTHIGRTARVTYTDGSTATGRIEHIEHADSMEANSAARTIVTLRVVGQRLEVGGRGFEEIVLVD